MILSDDKIGKEIHRLRKEQKVTVEKLSNGICTADMLRKYERGERFPDSMRRNRIMARLGKNCTCYESFEYISNYEKWVFRQRIADSINNMKPELAKQLLKKYLNIYDMENNVEAQFFLIMSGQLLKSVGGSRKKVAEIYKMAGKLTIPDIETADIDDMLLSPQEVNLILEYEKCRKTDTTLKRYYKLVHYIEVSKFDEVCKAVLYPKTICYMWEYAEGIQTERNSITDISVYTDMLKFCDKGISLLEKNNKRYYLWELIIIKEKLQKIVYENYQNKMENFKVQRFEEMWQNTKKYKHALEMAYQKTDISKEVPNSAYFYLEYSVYCVANVIRSRRRMLGMSRKALCEGICAVKTLSNIEKNCTASRRQIIKELFERLGLTVKYHKEYIEGNREADCCAAGITECIAGNKYDMAYTELEKLKRLADIKNPNNKQCILKLEAVIDFVSGKTDKQGYALELQAALECTISKNALFKAKSKYLTHAEIDCIEEIIKKTDDTVIKEQYIRVLDEFYEEYDRWRKAERVNERLMNCLKETLKFID